MVAYPGRMRFEPASGRRAIHYAPDFPVLNHNGHSGRLFGGNFWIHERLVFARESGRQSAQDLRSIRKNTRCRIGLPSRSGLKARI